MPTIADIEVIPVANPDAKPADLDGTTEIQNVVISRMLREKYKV